MTWTVIVGKSARKSLVKLPAKDLDKIRTALLAMAADPFSGDTIKLEGESNRWRRRVGSYRIFFSVDGTSRKVEVSAIVRRTSTTY